ncbi:MAG: glycosyltransferase [Clostridia bacterium]|jgi:glycosyltransferase involved in cell wall biosynthesis|nr:glycosyltransferase [Clostridia bacterium]
MNILVVDVAASESGALSILNQYFDELQSDTANQYFFCVSTPKLTDSGNITVLKFKWVKKSWLHRLYFDYATARKLIKKHNIARILSLQNTIVPMTKLSQTVYLHQALPFVDYKFKLRENKKMWIYQNVISRFISRSVIKADKVIVQTKWMKDAVAVRCKISGDKIDIIAPKIAPSKYTFKDTKQTRSTFFYPASAYTYKNHEVILQACELLQKAGQSDFSVTFTLNGAENEHAARLLKAAQAQSLKISFEGVLSHELVMQMYSKSVLLFPSYIESYPLPLAEARNTNTYIIASNLPFSKEILEGYDKAIFFDAFSAQELAEAMKSLIEKPRGAKQ